MTINLWKTLPLSLWHLQRQDKRRKRRTMEGIDQCISPHISKDMLSVSRLHKSEAVEGGEEEEARRRVASKWYSGISAYQMRSWRKSNGRLSNRSNWIANPSSSSVCELLFMVKAPRGEPKRRSERVLLLLLLFKFLLLAHCNPDSTRPSFQMANFYDSTGGNYNLNSHLSSFVNQ